VLQQIFFGLGETLRGLQAGHQFFQQLLLLGIELIWYLHLDDHYLVAAAPGVELRESLVLDCGIPCRAGRPVRFSMYIYRP